MSISIWRYSHLLLAISSSVFLMIASITGVILAVEPISQAIQPYNIKGLEDTSVSQSIVALRNEYEEVISLEIDANNFVLASVITKGGNSERIYVDPITGVKLGVPKNKPVIFEFARSLHRSLFLKSTGRFLVGLISFLLCFIVVTGVFLIVKRQGGIQRFFSKVHKEYFAQRYHVILGRWLLLPILIVAVTGVYLSAEKFSLLPSTRIKHKVTSEKKDKVLSIQNEPSVFETISLADVNKISFPFSDDEEDYYQIELKEKELLVNQFTGAVISEVSYPFVLLTNRLSFMLHTGQGSILWSIILLIASGSILFFIYSGFVMTFKRLGNRVKVPSVSYTKDECEYIILVGSETGSTFDFARLFYNALIKAKQRVFITDLNAYENFKNAKHIVVFTATYGDGEPTTNARKFEQLSMLINPNRKLLFSVVGFGSSQYPKFCHFAIKVDALLHSRPFFRPVLPLCKIDNQSFEVFQEWVLRWSDQVGISLILKPISKREEVSKIASFKVKERSRLNADETFLIRFKPKRKVEFQSGDLLSIQPEEDEAQRLYSIARIKNDVLLSVKKHELGVCSSYLNQLSEGDTIKATIKKNPKFYFPNDSTFYSRSTKKSVILIANGTGIAPFLGMLNQNKKHIPTHLFWGGRKRSSFELYKDIVEDLFSGKQLSSFTITYSREERKEYVQDAIFKKADLIARELDLGGIIMICGSLAMQRSVLAVLEKISKDTLGKPLDYFENRKQIKIDCY